MASLEATTRDGIHPASTRRDFLYIATGTAATVGAVAVMVPLIGQMNPDASTLAAGGRSRPREPCANVPANMMGHATMGCNHAAGFNSD